MSLFQSAAEHVEGGLGYQILEAEPVGLEHVVLDYDRATGLGQGDVDGAGGFCSLPPEGPAMPVVASA